MGQLSDIVAAQRRRVFLSYRRATASEASAMVRDYLLDVGFGVSVFRFEDEPKAPASVLSELASEIHASDHMLVVVGSIDDLHAWWLCEELDIHQRVCWESAPAFFLTRQCIHEVGTVPFDEGMVIYYNMGEGTVLYDISSFNFWLEYRSRCPPDTLISKHYFSDGVTTPAAITGHPLESLFFLEASMNGKGELVDDPLL